jgi:hypothetical protein
VVEYQDEFDHMRSNSPGPSMVEMRLWHALRHGIPGRLDFASCLSRRTPIRNRLLPSHPGPQHQDRWAGRTLAVVDEGRFSAAARLQRGAAQALLSHARRVVIDLSPSFEVRC